MTSKKCISAGLKLNRTAKMDKNAAQKRSFLHQQLPNMNNIGGLGGAGLNIGENNNLTTSPNNNAFLMQSMLPKYGSYDVNAALLAFGALPNPFNMMINPLPRHHIHSIQSLLGLTAQSGCLEGFMNSAHSAKTPSLHSDPEDMIEEVTDDANDENGKLIMDVDTDDMDTKPISEQLSPALSMRSSVMSPYSVHERRESFKKEDAYNENGFDNNNDLACSRCNKTFNHRTELAQHETILCGMIRKQEEALAAQLVESMAANFAANQAAQSQSNSEDERKVRVRTAISEEQQNVLKEYYAKNPKPGRDEFRTIAQVLHLDSRVVQVWFQNNRSRERKMNMGYGKQSIYLSNGHQNNVSVNIDNKMAENTLKSPIQLQIPQALLRNQLSPTFNSSAPLAGTDDQPLDLSIKKEGPPSTPSQSPRYGTALLQPEEVINLSRKSLLHPYMSELGFVPMDRILNAPEMARNGDTSSNVSEKQRHLFKEDSFGGSLSPTHGISLPTAPAKRAYVKQSVPEGEGQFICDQCDKAFNKQSSLARHKYEHSGKLLLLLFFFVSH